MDTEVIDRVIAAMPSRIDDDLVMCLRDGVAYQRDMTVTARYDGDYFNKCLGYEDKDIALKINAGRIDLVNRYVGFHTRVLDVGIGSGEFIKKRPFTFGYDVNPAAETWLKKFDLWREDFEAFDAFTFWDVIEHVQCPEHYFRRIKPRSHLFTSIPIFEDLRRVRESRHYRPGEHLYYFTREGFINWMRAHKFTLLKWSDFETTAGRESILSFAFRRSVS